MKIFITLLLKAVFSACSVQNQADKNTNPPIGRLAIVIDGNSPDPDDVGPPLSC
jgi:hypothetical protein